MVTPRSLRRALQRKPAAVRGGAGVLAGIIGMSAAAYGVSLVIEPYKGNGVRSAAESRDTLGAPAGGLVASIIDLVPSTQPGGLSADSGLLYSLDTSSDFVLSIVDGVQPPVNGGVTPPPGGDGGGGGSTLLPDLTPPPGGGSHDGSGIKAPNVGVIPPTAVPGLDGADLDCPELAPPPELAPDLVESEPAPSEAGEADGTDSQGSCSDESDGPAEPESTSDGEATTAA